MIIGIGNDIIDVTRVKKLYSKFGSKLCNKILHNTEINFLLSSNYNEEKRINFLAKRFSVKESFAKALGTGIGRIVSFKDLFIQKDCFNKPSLVLSDKLDQYIKQKYNATYITHISISDDSNLVFSTVIVEII